MDPLLDYFTNHPFLAGGAALMAIVVVAFEARRWSERGLVVGPAEAVRLMNEGAVLVDVRGPNQFKDGHIEGARNVPGDQIAAGSASLTQLADKTLILCCDSGTAGGAAARTLGRGGYSGKIFTLRGGLAAWRQENLPVVKS